MNRLSSTALRQQDEGIVCSRVTRVQHKFNSARGSAPFSGPRIMEERTQLARSGCMQSMSCACVLSNCVYLVVINNEVIVKKECFSVRA